MLKELLVVLKNAVNDHLVLSSGGGDAQMEQGPVVFLDGEKADVLDLRLGSVTLLLVNLEEEHTLRAGDPYRRIATDGTLQRVSPPIHLNAYVLFVARYKDYERSLQQISLILQYFQRHRVLDPQSHPALGDRIEKITMELLTLPFAEQNHLWSILRLSYQPSLLYKVRMAVFLDEEALALPVVVEPAVVIKL